MRITKRDLVACLKRLSKQEGRPFGSEVGALVLYHDSQGYQLQLLINDGWAVERQSDLLTSRELYYFLRGRLSAAKLPA